MIQDSPPRRRKTDRDIALDSHGVWLTYPVLIKYIVEIIIILVTGAGIYIALKFTYLNEKIDENKNSIERLDKSKVGWEDYDRWQRKNTYIDSAMNEPFTILYNEKTKEKGDKTTWIN